MLSKVANFRGPVSLTWTLFGCTVQQAEEHRILPAGATGVMGCRGGSVMAVIPGLRALASGWDVGGMVTVLDSLGLTRGASEAGT